MPVKAVSPPAPPTHLRLTHHIKRVVSGEIYLYAYLA
jgi:hypothetical protein